IGSPSLADAKAGFAGRLLGLDFDVVDLGTARPAAAPADQRVHALLVALEGRLDASVLGVADPARHPEGLGPLLRLCPEEDALHAAADPDVDARDAHPAKPSSPTSGTKRHGTECTTAGPSGLR